jgi:hypothetical protein
VSIPQSTFHFGLSSGARLPKSIDPHRPTVNGTRRGYATFKAENPSRQAGQPVIGTRRGTTEVG